MSSKSDKSKSFAKLTSRRDFLKKAGAGIAVTTLAESTLKAETWTRAFEQITPEYEYVIIGSGAGGGPLACRLAEAGRKVLLIEAGEPTLDAKTVIPAFNALSTEDPRWSWDFFVDHYTDQAKKERDFKYVPGKGILYPRASALGGCTIHNAMITMYPDDQDWTRIAKLTGDPSWNPKHMRSYFQKLENCNYRSGGSIFNLSKNGFDGWLSTEQNNIAWALKDAKLRDIILAALGEQGLLSEVDDLLKRQDFTAKFDPNDARYVQDKTEGVVNIPKATLNGKRSSPREFILDTQRRYPKNLKLMTSTFVTRLLFKGESREVDGVEVQRGHHLYQACPDSAIRSQTFGEKFMIRASQEVILCGGAFNSPQVLMLSGIGDKKHLDEQGIDCRHHLPGVGQNLQDRYEIGIVSDLKEPYALLKDCKLGDINDPCAGDYLQSPGSHIYSSNGFAIGVVKKSSFWRANPDTIVFGVPGEFRGYYPGWSKKAFNPKKFSWLVLKSQTENTAGVVKLKSSNPYQTPDINFHHFDEGNDHYNDDLNAMIQAVKTARRMNDFGPLKNRISYEVSPGFGIRSNEDIKQHVINEAWGHHASCSNKMGAPNDSMSVVDSEFKVHGVKNLRIVDASVFPRIPGMFIATPVYMISEKAADLIINKR